MQTPLLLNPGPPGLAPSPPGPRGAVRHGVRAHHPLLQLHPQRGGPLRRVLPFPAGDLRPAAWGAGTGAVPGAKSSAAAN